MSAHVWITLAGYTEGAWQRWYDEVAGQCESEAERAMARILVTEASMIVVDNDRARIIITPQHDLTRSHAIPYRADFMVVTHHAAFVVEVDGFAWHSDQAAFQRDRRRDRAFAAAGLPVMRFTAKECLEPGEPGNEDSTYSEIRKALL